MPPRGGRRRGVAAAPHSHRCAHLHVVPVFLSEDAVRVDEVLKPVGRGLGESHGLSAQTQPGPFRTLPSGGLWRGDPVRVVGAWAAGTGVSRENSPLLGPAWPRPRSALSGSSWREPRAAPAPISECHAAVLVRHLGVTEAEDVGISSPDVAPAPWGRSCRLRNSTRI